MIGSPERGGVHAAALWRVEWIVFIIVLAVTTPPIDLPLVGERRADELVLAAAVVVFCAQFLTRGVVGVAWGQWQSLWLGAFVIVAISIVAGGLRGFGAGPPDLFQFVRLAKYLVVYTLVATVVEGAPNRGSVRRSMLRAIALAGVLLFPVVVQQYFDLFGWNDSYVRQVSRPGQAASLVAGGDDYAVRPVGMIGNPNELGFLYAIVGIVANHLALTSRRAYVAYLVLVIMSGAAIIMSASRSASMALAIGMAWTMVRLALQPSPGGYGHHGRRVARALITLVVLTVAIAGFASSPWAQQAPLWRFELLANVGQDPSFQGRLIAWRENARLFMSSPWFGVGPLFDVDFQYAADNEWLLLLRSYGFVGVGYLIASFAVPYLAGVRPGALPEAKAMRPVTEGVLLALAAYMIPAGAFHSLVLMPLVLIIFAAHDATLVMRLVHR